MMQINLGSASRFLKKEIMDALAFFLVHNHLCYGKCMHALVAD